MKNKDQVALKELIGTRDDIQSLRKKIDNRLGKKADGTEQNIERELDVRTKESLGAISLILRTQEPEVAKTIKGILKTIPIYNQFLSSVKGVGEVASGWILGEFDIEKATTVSKMWQFAGLNSGMVRGKKSVKKKDYKPKMGEIVGSLPPTREGENRVIVLTNEMVRGDKLTEGFLSPFNKKLRTALVGVLADGFIKAQSSYALEFYYPYKSRLAESHNEVVHRGKETSWKDVSLGHRDRAANRYMIKAFLKDLYAAWREVEGLSVRVPYAEEFLGKKHSDVEEQSKLVLVKKSTTKKCATNKKESIKVKRAM